MREYNAFYIGRYIFCIVYSSFTAARWYLYYIIQIQTSRIKNKEFNKYFRSVKMRTPRKLETPLENQKTSDSQSGSIISWVQDLKCGNVSFQRIPLRFKGRGQLANNFSLTILLLLANFRSNSGSLRCPSAPTHAAVQPAACDALSEPHAEQRLAWFSQRDPRRVFFTHNSARLSYFMKF